MHASLHGKTYLSILLREFYHATGETLAPKVYQNLVRPTSGLSNLTLLICYILVSNRADGSFVPSAIQGCSHEEGVRCSFDGDGAAGT